MEHQPADRLGRTRRHLRPRSARLRAAAGRIRGAGPAPLRLRPLGLPRAGPVQIEGLPAGPGAPVPPQTALHVVHNFFAARGDQAATTVLGHAAPRTFRLPNPADLSAPTRRARGTVVPRSTRGSAVRMAARYSWVAVDPVVSASGLPVTEGDPGRRSVARALAGPAAPARPLRLSWGELPHRLRARPVEGPVAPMPRRTPSRRR